MYFSARHCRMLLYICENSILLSTGTYFKSPVVVLSDFFCENFYFTSQFFLTKRMLLKCSLKFFHIVCHSYSYISSFSIQNTGNNTSAYSSPCKGPTCIQPLSRLRVNTEEFANSLISLSYICKSNLVLRFYKSYRKTIRNMKI